EHGIGGEIRRGEVDRALRSVVAPIHAVRERTRRGVERGHDGVAPAGIDADGTVDQRLLCVQGDRGRDEHARRQGKPSGGVPEHDGLSSSREYYSQASAITALSDNSFACSFCRSYAWGLSAALPSSRFTCASCRRYAAQTLD